MIMIMFGPYLNDSIDVVSSSLKVFLTLFGDKTIQEYRDSLLGYWKSGLIFIGMTVILNFIMLKYTITIVIIRYKYLREKIQLSRKIRKIVKNIYYNFA